MRQQVEIGTKLKAIADEKTYTVIGIEIQLGVFGPRVDVILESDDVTASIEVGVLNRLIVSGGALIIFPYHA